MAKLYFSYSPAPKGSKHQLTDEFFFCHYDVENEKSTWTGWCKSIIEAKEKSLSDDTDYDGFDTYNEFYVYYNEDEQVTFEVSCKEDIPDTFDELIEKYPEHFI